MRYITVEDLSFYYDKEPVLEHINYSVDSGEFVTLTGENGAAKTTLIKASLGILQPRIGKVTISTTNTQGKKLRIAYLPQQIASFNAGFPSTVYEFVKSGRYPRKGWFRRLNAHDEEQRVELILKVSAMSSMMPFRKIYLSLCTVLVVLEEMAYQVQLLPFISQVMTRISVSWRNWESSLLLRWSKTGNFKILMTVIVVLTVRKNKINLISK